MQPQPDETPPTPTRSKRHIRRYVALAVIASLVIIGIWAGFQPATANHFTYALPGPGNLPYRVYYAGRAYQNKWMCAGADWCQQYTGPGYCPGATVCARPASVCATPTTLHGLAALPLHRVGFVWTWFGLPHGIFIGPNGGLTAGIYVEDTAGCYIEYSLDGGP